MNYEISSPGEKEIRARCDRHSRYVNKGMYLTGGLFLASLGLASIGGINHLRNPHKDLPMVVEYSKNQERIGNRISLEKISENHPDLIGPQRLNSYMDKLAHDSKILKSHPDNVDNLNWNQEKVKPYFIGAGLSYLSIFAELLFGLGAITIIGRREERDLANLRERKST